MVDNASISQMANFVSIINGNKTNTATITPNETLDNISSMKRILEQFNGSTDRIVEKLIKDEPNDRPLREAMTTVQTETGVLIGYWEIRTKKISNRHLYDVIKIGEIAPIAVDLTLYEAAYGLAYSLNEGHPITHPSIRNILHLEEEYASAIHDAIHAKHLLKKPLKETRKEVIEDKYHAAIRRGKSVKLQISKLMNQYPLL